VNRLLPYLLIVLLLRPILASEGWAVDLYVDNQAGDDRFDGASPTSDGGGGGPFRTIHRALRSASRGQRIHLANTGTAYRESISLQGGHHSGSQRRPFELIGNGAVLEGAAPVPPHFWEHVGAEVYRFAPPLKSHQMLFLDGVPAERVAVQPGDRDVPALQPLQWCLFQRHIYFRPEEGRSPDQHALSYCDLTVGITLYEVRGVVVRDLIVQGFQLDGINAHDGVFDTTLRGVVCRGNARSGVSVGGASRVLIDSCILGNNGAAQLRTEGYSYTRVTDSHLLDNAAPAVVRDGGRVEIDDAR
jgi:hypothetical protein